MRRLYGGVGIAALAAIAVSVAPSYAAQPAERELIGIRIWRTDTTVMTKYGQPSRVEKMNDILGIAPSAPDMAGTIGSMGGGMAGAMPGGMPGAEGGMNVPAPPPDPNEGKVVWTYEKGANTYVFIINKDKRVIQIQAKGDKGPAVTSRGIKLGSSLLSVLKAYGPTSQITNAGPMMTMDYGSKFHVIFELINKGGAKGYQVNAITVSLEEMNQLNIPAAAPAGMAPGGMPGAMPGGMPGGGMIPGLPGMGGGAPSPGGGSVPMMPGKGRKGMPGGAPTGPTPGD